MFKNAKQGQSSIVFVKATADMASHWQWHTHKKVLIGKKQCVMSPRKMWNSGQKQLYYLPNKRTREIRELEQSELTMWIFRVYFSHVFCVANLSHYTQALIGFF